MAAVKNPPPWMKTNNEWTGYSCLKRKYYQTWANYHLNAAAAEVDGISGLYGTSPLMVTATESKSAGVKSFVSSAVVDGGASAWFMRTASGSQARRPQKWTKYFRRSWLLLTPQRPAHSQVFGDMMPHFYKKFDKSFLARLCIKLSRAAEGGKCLTKYLFDEAGENLGRMTAALMPKVQTNDLKSDPFKIVCAGSVWLSLPLLAGFLRGFLSGLQ
uniref:Uncharacterized protein n=1 Tax=Glossina austeni TaxID=7395 RepID=A0A1A9UU27_GLOAU